MKNFIALISMIIAVVVSSCSNSSRIMIFSGETMGTTYNIKIVNDKNLSIHYVKQQVDDYLKNFNSVMSCYDPKSEISQFNKDLTTSWHLLSNELYDVLKESKLVYQMTSGAFDVTVAPAVELWGFNANGIKRIPSTKEITAVSKMIGSKFLDIHPKELKARKLNPQIRINLSAVAKGFGVDQVSKLLEKLGIENFMVEIGGEVRVKGTKGKQLWKVAITDPLSPKTKYMQLLKVSDIAIATSGNYRNYFVEKDSYFSHTIDPKTAMPVTHRLISATVLDNTCVRADALATALMVMGPKEATRYIEENRLIAFLVFKVEGDDNLFSYSSDRLKKFLVE